MYRVYVNIKRYIRYVNIKKLINKKKNKWQY